MRGRISKYTYSKRKPYVILPVILWTIWAEWFNVKNDLIIRIFIIESSVRLSSLNWKGGVFKLFDISLLFTVKFWCSNKLFILTLENVHSSELCANKRFLSFHGSCFEFNVMNTTYFEAQRLCHQKDAELTSIHNRRENIFLSDVHVSVSFVNQA